MKINFILPILLIMASASVTTVGQDSTAKDTTKPVVIVTKENLSQKVDSLKKPWSDTIKTYQKKISNIDEKIDSRLKELDRLQKKKNTKTVYVTKKVIIRDTVVIEKETDTVQEIKKDTVIKKKTFLQKINPFYKHKKNEHKESKTPSDK